MSGSESETGRIVEVAAAVLQRPAATEGGLPDFLLAQRPPGKVYAGYWEFPGGKVEAGESVAQALVRELQEEMGITVTAATPWLVRQFVYPHATVRLTFFRVTAWAGEITPLEHSGLAWQFAGTAASVAPILPANDPVIKALSLPVQMAITHAEANGVEAELLRLQQALQGGLRLIQLRDKTLPVAERTGFAIAASQLARQHQAILCVNDDEVLARQVGAAGLHLSAARLLACTERPGGFSWVGASCHNAAELAQAEQLGLDYVLLGPVLPTATHPAHPGLGWPTFAARIADCPLPVFALGGMQADMLETARMHRAHGIALMRGW